MATARTHTPARPGTTFDYATAETAIYRSLGADGILAEYKTIGVRFTTGVPKPNGIAECYSCLREEGNPSAGVSVTTGMYFDSGGDKANAIHIWELAARKGMWGGDWKDARKYYAALACVDLPNTHQSRKRNNGRRAKRTKKQAPAGIARTPASAVAPTDSGLRGDGGTPATTVTTTIDDWRTALHFEPWSEGYLRLLDSWCRRHKPGVTMEAFLAAGGRFARYRKSGVHADTGEAWEREWSVYCLPIFGPGILDVIADTTNTASPHPTDEQLASATVGWCCWSRNPLGDPLTRWDKTTHAPVPIKMKTVGAADGVIGLHAIRRLHAVRHDPTTTPIAALWKVEGPTDLLALFAAAEPHTRDAYPIITTAGGAKSFNPWHVEFFRTLPQANVLHDADTTGEAGAVKVCRMLAGVCGKVCRYELDYPVVPKHGQDLRDFIASGRSYIDVTCLNQWEDAWVDDGVAVVEDHGDQDSMDNDDDQSSDDPHPFDPLSLACESGRTETASARRFATVHVGRLRYCQPWKSWFYWDGRRWKQDRECHVQGLAKAYAESLWSEITVIAEKHHSENLAEALEKFAKRSNTKLSIENILFLARSEPNVPVLPDQFDRQHSLLNIENGVLDLCTGELLPHDPSLMLSKLAPVTYDPAAECPTWLRFIAEITAPVDDPASLPPSADVDNDSATTTTTTPAPRGDAYEPLPPPDGMLVKEYLQRLAGWCLTGLIRKHAMPFFYGKGSNGKSTFINILLEILGPDYAMKAPPELIMTKSRDSHPTERADLFGKRLVVTNEIEEGRRLAESLVKDLTGSDPIRARRMHEDFWEFLPTHKLIVAGNHKPTVRGMDEGLWRRIKLVPFNRQFNDDEKDESLPEKLAAERSGILNWCLAGCRAWFESGLPEPAIIADATKEYRNEQDVFGNYLLERCVIGSWAKVRSSTLYADYVHWCETSGERHMTMKKFGQVIIEDPRFSRRTSNGVWYDGIALRADAAPDDTQNARTNDTEFDSLDDTTYTTDARTKHQKQHQPPL